MKKIFIFLTVLSITTMLLAGCTTSESGPTPDQTDPIIAPAPGQEVPDYTPEPDQETPSTKPTPAPTTQPPSARPSNGTLTVLVTDAPSYVVDNVTVYFSKVEVHKSAGGTDGEGEWIEIPLEKTVDDQTFFEDEGVRKIDLNADMGEVVLAQSEQVEAGIKYTQIRVYMDEDYENHPVEVTYHEDVDGEAGEPQIVPAKLPSGILKLVRPLVVEAGEETRIVLDFNLQDSVVFTGSKKDINVIVKPVVKLEVTMGSSECDTDAELILENKDPDNDWAIIDDDDISGVLRYSTEGEKFCYDFDGVGLDDIEYSLIYYADTEDRFNDWGGDNPGALIASGIAVDGTLVLAGSVNLREDLTGDLGMDLPHTDDANSYYWNYADDTDPNYTGDGYDTAYGAKIWLVPSECYDEELYEVTSWEPERFLFETDLINFDDIDWEP